MQNSILVIGAGIAGLSAIEALFQDYDQVECKYDQVILLSDTKLIKRVINYSSRGRQLESFDVTQGTIDDLQTLVPEGLSFKFILGTLEYVDVKDKKAFYKDKSDTAIPMSISYDKLCICIGSSPRQLEISNFNSQSLRDRIIVIRDTDTVRSLQAKLKSCKKLVIVGNGGISLELISNIKNCEKIWIIRDEFIGSSYFDSEAAKFLLNSFHDQGRKSICNVFEYTQIKDKVSDSSLFGPSLGPNWSQDLQFLGSAESFDNNLKIIYNDEVIDVSDNLTSGISELTVITKNHKTIYCDLVALAIGVRPNKLVIKNGCLKTSGLEGGLLIDNEMRTSIDDIYAAGDIVSCENWKHSKLWFQKRLWTQARQMGFYAGRCIAANLRNLNPAIYFNFDCFTHCTSFFGFRLVLLGRYNGQDLDENIRVKVRIKPNKDYVKIIIDDTGRIIGSVLIGDSGLEETIENLIHDRLDISPFEDQLLDESVDIEDYFD